MGVSVGSARSDENKKAYGGKAGDQTGREVSTQAWYLHSKGWRVFRLKNREKAKMIAKGMRAACANAHIGYDQWQRHTLYKAAAAVGFDPGRVTVDCETDCSALVRVLLASVDIKVPEDFRTGNMPKYLLNSGAVVEMTGSKYQSQSTYLGAGDILVTKTNGHTVVVLDDGPKYEGEPEPPKAWKLGDRLLKYGCEGADVKAMQEILLALDYPLGKWGADGDFGDCTELAVKAFQIKTGLEVDGICGPATLAAMAAAMDVLEPPKDGKVVRIQGGSCYIRSAPNTDGKILGIAKAGSELPFGGEVSPGGWPLVAYTPKGETVPVNAWVSGKYGKIVG